MPLRTRFRATSSSRTGSPRVRAGSGVVSTSMCALAASCAVSSTAPAAISDRSTGMRLATCPSLLARVSSPSMISSLRRLVASTVSTSWRSSAGTQPPAIATSSIVRLVASGVRSSCEALATNWRWPSKAASRRSSMASKVSASSLSSSSGPCSEIRSSRRRSATRRAISVIPRTGRMALPAMPQPSATAALATTARAITDWISTVASSRARCRSSCCRMSLIWADDRFPELARTLATDRPVG